MFGCCARRLRLQRTFRVRAAEGSLAPRPVLAPPLSPVVVEGLDSVLPGANGASLPVQRVWEASREVRASRAARRAHGACVVGGAAAVRRIWREYGVRPTVVYAPQGDDPLPPWCLEPALPTHIVRCPPVHTRRHLLSAEHSDGFAAEFPWLPDRLAPADALLPAGPGSGEVARVDSMLVLVGLRIPSNVGTLVRAAVDMGYASVLLVDCVDPFQEKALRGGEGAAYSPRVRLFEGPSGGGSAVALLSAIAAQHRLTPLLAVPSQKAEPAFTVATRLHAHNRDRSPTDRTGPMVVLGSESGGLGSLDGDWGVPFHVVTLPLPHSFVDSYNVAVAGSVLLHMFRARAAPHFAQLAELHAAADADKLPSNSSPTPQELSGQVFKG